jgi:hypothetical protein
MPAMALADSRPPRKPLIEVPSWLTPAVRVRSFTVVIALAAAVLYLVGIRDLRPLPSPFAIPWPVAALAFYLGETSVVEVHFLRERHSFSLSELPGILGLFFLSPTDYLLAVLLGTGIALFADRSQSLIKSAFNIAQFALAAAVALAIFHTLATDVTPPGPREWFAAFLAAAATSAIEATLVATAISLSGGGTAVPATAQDVELQRNGRDGQHQPCDACRHGPVDRPALDRPARRPHRHRLCGVPGVHG